MGGRGTVDTKKQGQLDESKAGSVYQSLPWSFKNNIQVNLALSKAMRDNIDSPKPVKMTDEWTTSLKGTKEKRKVITEYDNGKLYYTVKNGNKILLKQGSVEQAANQIALFYDRALRKKERERNGR